MKSMMTLRSLIYPILLLAALVVCVLCLIRMVQLWKAQRDAQKKKKLWNRVGFILIAAVALLVLLISSVLPLF